LAVVKVKRLISELTNFDIYFRFPAPVDDATLFPEFGFEEVLAEAVANLDAQSFFCPTNGSLIFKLAALKGWFLTAVFLTVVSGAAADSPKVQLEKEGDAIPLPSLRGLVLQDDTCVLNTGGVAWAIEWCPMSMVAECDGGLPFFVLLSPSGCSIT
jgi:hypothetical protein